nr:hypothetical protein [Microbacterium bovistercoris]
MTDPTLHDLLDEATWLEWRARAEAFPALVSTDLVTTEQTRAEFVEGARLLRLDHKERAGDHGHGPSPVQLLVADTLNAGRFMNVIFEPRRTTKTTSVQAVLLGRCTYREDYQVGWTMLTTGAKASERFRKDIVAPIERLYPSAKARPMTVNVGKGTEHLAFTNGSFLNVYTPNGDGFRSGGFDVAFADEGGEADVDLSLDIAVAVIPTMDTKVGAQFIIAGTGGRVRSGNLMWDNLQDPDAGVLWHGIPDTTDPAALEAWEPDDQHPRARMRELIEAAHPGVGYTTPIESVKRSFDKMPREQFLREYGGQFGTEGAADVLIPPAWWESAARDAQPTATPRDAVAALKVHHNGTCASLVVSWTQEHHDLVSAALELDGIVDPSKRVRVMWLLHWQTGTDGLANAVLNHMRRMPRVPLVYDAYGHTEAIAQQLTKARPRPILVKAARNDIPVSTVKLLQGLEERSIVHYRQPELDRAAAIAVKHAFGNYGTFRFGPPKTDPDADVTPLEAAALAIHHLDATNATGIRPDEAMQFAS